MYLRKSDMMDWLKRLFFHYEDEEEEIEWEDNKNKKKKQEATNDDYIEMETRVAYQYPRNNRSNIETPKTFSNRKQGTRPVKKLPISEIQNSLYERYPKLKEIHNRSTVKQENKGTKPIEKPVFEKKEIQQKPKVEKQQTKQPEKPKIGSRRFRPTEVPSPIYGFQKRVKEREEPKVADVVEFELSSFESSPSKTDEKQQMKENDRQTNDRHHLGVNITQDLALVNDTKLNENIDNLDLEKDSQGETTKFVEIEGPNETIDQFEKDSNLQGETEDFNSVIEESSQNVYEDVKQETIVTQFDNELIESEESLIDETLEYVRESLITGNDQHDPTGEVEEQDEFEVIVPVIEESNQSVHDDVEHATNVVQSESEVASIDRTEDSVHESVQIIENDQCDNETEEEPSLIEEISEQSEIVHEKIEYEADAIEIELTKSVSEETSHVIENEAIDDVEIEDENVIVDNENHDFTESDVGSFEQSEENHEPSTEDLKNSEEQETRQPTTKRHIPFNVIMLKSDREKLKRKQEAIKARNQFLQRQTETKQEVPKQETQQINDEQQTESQQSNDINEQKNSANHEVAATKIEENDKIVSYENYEFPSREFLQLRQIEQSDEDWIEKQREILDQTLKSFNVGAKVVNVSVGPAVTRFELSPDMGVKVSKITSLTDDIKLSLAARDIRIEAPIPGKHTIGIEVPNRKARPVFLREIIDRPAFIEAESPLTVGLGLDITGKPIMTDLKKMPHGLIAGATGSGKSVSINTFIVSLLYKARPDEVKLLLIDPKMVELAPYNGIPHLISPVITNVKAATQSLKWAVEEMERRYELFAHLGVRDISKFNEKADDKHRLPYIVIIIDELADLMMMAPADVEEAIARIAQKARACGIHLLIATQRPSVDVITGLIKANVPTRIAFSVSSQIDSRTILDVSGAERLLGKGDMLFIENGTSKPIRIQGAFISDEEIEKVVDHVRTQGEPDYLFEQEELMKKSDFEEQDELLFDACKFAVEQGHISTSSLQRQFRIGYNRAARMIDMMEEKGIITESKGSKPRDVLITEQDLEKLNGLN